MTRLPYATLDEWIQAERIAFSPDSQTSVNAVADAIAGAVGPAVSVLGLGEPMHGNAMCLSLRNRLFRRLMEVHRYTAVAIESSFPRGRVVDDYVAGRGGARTFDDLCDAGFSHGFGNAEGSRQLVEWMQAYNAEPSHERKLSFYGFDSPTEMSGAESPRQLITYVLDYLASVEVGDARRSNIEKLIESDAAWQNPAAMFDPSKSIGRSPATGALRVEVEDLVAALRVGRPDWIARGGAERFAEAEQYASAARQLLNYHAAMADDTPDRLARLLGLRDVFMADTLAYVAARERRRGGKVLAFAHNSHLQRGRAQWQLGPNALLWWPAGAHLATMLGEGYAVIGVGVATSETDGIGQPEPGTLEARIGVTAAAACFIPTHQGAGLPAGELAAMPTRSGSPRSPGYFPFTPQSVQDFDGLIIVSG